VTDKDLGKYLPIGVQKSYFLLPKAEREILNIALERYQPGQQDPILVGDNGLLKTALRLMSVYRLKIERFDNAEIVYTRWIESVQVRGENHDVYLTFSPRFKRIWMQAQKKLPDHLAQNPIHVRLRSKYAVRLYEWAKHAAGGTKRITVEDIRKLFGLELVKDADGKIVRESPLAVWGNLRQRAVEVALSEINKKTDVRLEIESLEKVGPRITALNFSIVPQKNRKTGKAKQ
jgi:plasmid replication initiation protein